MTGFEIFWPMVAHVALVFALYALLSARRVALVKAGKIEASVFRENRDEPDESLVVRNSISNQFELPVLFHLCCVLLYVTEADNILSLGLAWSRLALRGAPLRARGNPCHRQSAALSPAALHGGVPCARRDVDLAFRLDGDELR